MDKKSLLGSKAGTTTNRLNFKTERSISSKKKRHSAVDLKIERNERTAEKAGINFRANDDQY